MSDKPQEKVSPRLRAKLDDADSGQAVEVVVALAPPVLPDEGSRGQKIAAAKQRFEREVASVSERIASAGGEIIDAAWINSTIHTRLRAEQVDDLAADEHVVTMDLPTKLEAED
ncbi:hypothetical protein OG558_23875 [Kribbella sp. NBC_01510]|uniref:hypothetical protein n=1 Tax=Kribbella sp. NBC_01510 TaxID=2903581 RepID=UPI00386604A8